MKFMLLIYPNAGAEEGLMPSAELISAMMKYNEEMANAGILLGLDGLQASSKGARIKFADGKATVTDGPFTETKEIVGGYWMIKVGSKEEAVAWAARCPAEDGNMIEVRQVFDVDDFPAESRDPEAEQRIADTLAT